MLFTEVLNRLAVLDMAAMLNRAGQMTILNRARISRATVLDKGGDAELCGEDL
jgi:hypothetical protein